MPTSPQLPYLPQLYLPLQSLGNFAAFNARFRMPSLESGADHGASMWYSFNVGPVHFVVVDTETDFPGAGGDHLSWVGGFEGGGEEGDNGGFGDQIAWLEEVRRRDAERLRGRGRKRKEIKERKRKRPRVFRVCARV